MRQRGACLLLVTLHLVSACSLPLDRDLEENDLDGDLPEDDADIDDGGADVDEPLRCQLDEALAPLHVETDPFRVTAIDRLAQDVFVVGVVFEEDQRGVLWVLHGRDLRPLAETVLGEQVVARQIRYDWSNGVVLATLSRGEVVTLSTFEVGVDWTLSPVLERELCQSCQPASLVPRTSWVTTVTEASERGEAQLHLVPLDPQEPIITSAAVAGASPVALYGTFGPKLLLLVDEAVAAASYHWDGRRVGEPQGISGTSGVTRFDAAGQGDELYLAAVMGEADAEVSLLLLDGEGRRRGQRQLAALSGAASAIDLSVGPASVALFWREQGRGAPLVAAVAREDFALVLDPTPLAAPAGDGTVTSLAVAAARSGHAAVWTQRDDEGGVELRGAMVSCVAP